MRAPLFGATRRRVGVLTTILALLVETGGARAFAAPPETAAGDTATEPVAAELARLRRAVPCVGVPTADAARELVHRGRPATGVTGRERTGEGEAPGSILDFSIFDPAAGRFVSFVCFANASTRQAGEPIISLAEISTLADARVLAVLPGSALALESIQRYRASGQQSVYYEARYATTKGDPPFLEPPVRLLLNASNGTLFRLDVDPDWLDPPRPQRLMISRKAAERIARVVLGRLDPAAVFGAGATIAGVGTAELFMVRANGALRAQDAAEQQRAQPAWVVPFQLGGAAAGTQTLFVEAAGGRVLGGSFGVEAAPPLSDPAGLRETR